MELVINFSGGKDSCAMLHFLCEKYPQIKKHVVFADTGWEHKGTEEWCRNIVAAYGLELNVVKSSTKDFFSMVRHRKMFPGMQTRQCTSDLKRGPIAKWIRNNIKSKVIINCLGIRSDESVSRAKQKRLIRNKTETNTKRTVWNWLPIHNWTEDYTYEYLNRNGIALHPVYSYLRRFSCRVCIYMSQNDLQKVSENDPEAIQIIASTEKEIGFTMFQAGPVESLINLNVSNNEQ